LISNFRRGDLFLDASAIDVARTLPVDVWRNPRRRWCREVPPPQAGSGSSDCWRSLKSQLENLKPGLAIDVVENSRRTCFWERFPVSAIADHAEALQREKRDAQPGQQLAVGSSSLLRASATINQAGKLPAPIQYGIMPLPCTMPPGA